MSVFDRIMRVNKCVFILCSCVSTKLPVSLSTEAGNSISGGRIKKFPMGFQTNKICKLILGKFFFFPLGEATNNPGRLKEGAGCATNGLIGS